MSESLSKKEELEAMEMTEGEGDEEEINIDLNDHFNYTLDEQRLAPSPVKHTSSFYHHHLPISSTITAEISAAEDFTGPSSASHSSASGPPPQLNNFEKLLQVNHFSTDMTPLTQSHPSSAHPTTAAAAAVPTKNFYDKIQDRHEEYFLTTQVDHLKALKNLDDLHPKDFISSSLVTERQGNETSLQACVAMLFGFQLTDLSQYGGALPALSTQDPRFEHQLDQWIALHTHCSSHLIPYSVLLDSSIEIQCGRLCILYGMMSTQSPKHCYVGYIDVNTSSRSPQVRCLLDPSDPDCIADGHKISQNTIRLELIEWVLCFTDSDDQGSHFCAHNHHTEVLSLEESGLFTQEEQNEKPQCSDVRDQEATDSYMKLAQSTVDHDPTLNTEEVSSNEEMVAKNSLNEKCLLEEPTEIVPVEDMTNYVNSRPDPPKKSISLALSSPSEGM